MLKNLKDEALVEKQPIIFYIFIIMSFVFTIKKRTAINWILTYISTRLKAF